MPARTAAEFPRLARFSAPAGRRVKLARPMHLLLLASSAWAHQVVQLSGHLPDGSADSDEVSEELLFPMAVATATMVFAAVGLAVWSVGKGSAGKAAAPPSPRAIEQTSEAQRRDEGLRWLGELLLATFLIFAAQLTLGLLVRSLTLLADAAHVFADVISYGFSYGIERAKVRAGTGPQVADRLDALSAAFSAALVIGTSLYAAVDAGQRLQREGPVAAAGSEASAVGPALLGFAVASFAANAALALLQSRRRLAGPRAVEPPPPHPPPPPVAEDRPRRGRARPSRTPERVAWLHAAFHPSCDPTTCGASAPPAPGGAAPPEAVNLNVDGALLHLLADVLRSVVILIAGLLLQCGVIRDAAHADVVCALVVSVLIVLGSVVMLRKVVVALRRSFGSRPAAPPEPV